MKLFRKMEIEADEFKVGDVIAFTLKDGEEVEAMAMKQESDGMLFCLVDCLMDEEPMNRTNTTRGGYDGSALRKKLNTQIIYRFSDELREKMVAFDNGDLLMLPSEMEVFGKKIYSKVQENGQQWEPMKLRRNRIAFRGKNGEPEWWWLRSVYSAAGFAYVSFNGCAGLIGACYSNGIRPAVKISI